jgi:uncharacterized Zn finger protein
LSFYYFSSLPYISVAEKRRRAELKLKKLRNKGQRIEPVRIEGRKIATSFWGQSWCANLERYSDYESRLPRGRSYVRNGAVLDLQITNGQILALVSGSDLYEIKVSIVPVAARCWKAMCRDCAGSIDSLVELLQGRLAKSVMDRVCRKGDGLFPSPDEIKLSCSCPDWADMCKHVAAVLYGVGARLDQKPQLLFVLRGVDESELLAGAGKGFLSTNAPTGVHTLDQSDVAALFGIEIAKAGELGKPAISKRHKSQRSLTKPRTPKVMPASAKKIGLRRPTRKSSGIQSAS